MNTQAVKNHTSTMQHSSELSLTDLYNYPSLSAPKLSPCETYYSFLAPAPEGGAPTIWIAKNGQSPRALIPYRTRPITNYSWLRTSTHILFIEDEDGNEKGHLYLIDIETTTVTNLTPSPGARVLPRYFLSDKYPHKVVFQYNTRDEAVYDLWCYDLTTGEISLLEQNPGNIISWYVDNNLECRARASFNQDNVITLYTRSTTYENWSPRAIWQPEDTFTSHGLFFSPDNKTFYFADTRNTATNLLQSINLESGSISPLFQDPHYDVYHEATLTDILDKTAPHASTLWGNDGSLSAFSYFRERLAWKFLNNNIKENYPALYALLVDPTFETWIEHENKNYFFIGRCNTTHPPFYYRYDKRQDLCVSLASSRPGVHEKLSSLTTMPISVLTADDLTVHGYLTLPKESSKPHPLVLKIHGGPWTRDTYGYSPDIQMLVNNGYACLQVNYRGSTGYGKKFASAGAKQLGKAMIDDVILMLQYALTHYPLDAQRIIYMGRSYGGFSALTAGWRYQHLFKAIIAQVPVTDLKLLLDSYPKHWSLFKYHFHRRTGHPEKEAAMLLAQSPVTHGHTVTIPTLISYGLNDARVVPEHVYRYLKIMHQSPHNKVICFENEGHFNLLQESLLRHWQTALDFIKTHI